MRDPTYDACSFRTNIDGSVTGRINRRSYGMRDRRRETAFRTIISENRSVGRTRQFRVHRRPVQRDSGKSKFAARFRSAARGSDIPYAFLRAPVRLIFARALAVSVATSRQLRPHGRHRSRDSVVPSPGEWCRARRRSRRRTVRFAYAASSCIRDGGGRVCHVRSCGRRKQTVSRFARSEAAAAGPDGFGTDGDLGVVGDPERPRPVVAYRACPYGRPLGPWDTSQAFGPLRAGMRC